MEERASPGMEELHFTLSLHKWVTGESLTQGYCFSTPIKYVMAFLKKRVAVINC